MRWPAIRILLALIALSSLPRSAIAQGGAVPASPGSPPPSPAAPPPASPASPAKSTPAPASPAAPAPAAAQDDPKARAKALFERGVAAYEGARYTEALASFQEAFRLRPHPLVRVNIANCYDKLGKPLEALFHFDQFLSSDVPTPAQRQEVVAAVERLRKQLGTVALRVTPDGAFATIDGGEQRRTPVMDPIQLPAGTHSVEVRLDGYQTVQRGFNVPGGASIELEIVLEPEGAAPVIAVTPAAGSKPAVAPKAAAATSAAAESALPAERATPTPTGSEKPLPTHVWILGGVSAAMLAGATITGILALGAQSDFDRYSTLRRDAQAPLAQRASYDDALDAADRADGLALATDILLVGALVSATAATIFAITDDGEAAPAKVQASLGPAHAELGVQLTF